jgi:manganese/iron transport system permease protein
MDWLTDPFALAFQQRALLGGALATVATSAAGIWVVVRG